MSAGAGGAESPPGVGDESDESDMSDEEEDDDDDEDVNDHRPPDVSDEIKVNKRESADRNTVVHSYAEDRRNACGLWSLAEAVAVAASAPVSPSH